MANTNVRGHVNTSSARSSVTFQSVEGAREQTLGGLPPPRPDGGARAPPAPQTRLCMGGQSQPPLATAAAAMQLCREGVEPSLFGKDFLNNDAEFQNFSPETWPGKGRPLARSYVDSPLPGRMGRGRRARGELRASGGPGGCDPEEQLGCGARGLVLCGLARCTSESSLRAFFPAPE